MIQDKWLRFNKRVVHKSSISAMQYNPDKFELRVYEHSGYTNVLETTEDEVAKLMDILNISPKTLIFELGD